MHIERRSRKETILKKKEFKSKLEKNDFDKKQGYHIFQAWELLKTESECHENRYVQGGYICSYCNGYVRHNDIVLIMSTNYLIFKMITSSIPKDIFGIILLNIKTYMVLLAFWFILFFAINHTDIYLCLYISISMYYIDLSIIYIY